MRDIRRRESNSRFLIGGTALVFSKRGAQTLVMRRSKWRDLGLVGVGLVVGAIFVHVFFGGDDRAEKERRSRATEVAVAPAEEPSDEDPEAPPDQNKPRPRLSDRPWNWPKVEPAKEEPVVSPSPSKRSGPGVEVAVSGSKDDRLTPRTPGSSETEVVPVDDRRALLVVATWEGPIPERVLPPISRPQCARFALWEDIVPKDFDVSRDGHLKDVFVYLEQPRVLWSPTPLQPVRLDQRGCRFEPHVFGIQIDQPLIIRNADPFIHNVNAAGLFNQALPKPMELTKKFKKEQLGLEIRCDVHTFMSATAYVLTHPFFAATDARGRAQIIPPVPGKYMLVAVHPKLPAQRREVEIGAEPKLERFVFSASLATSTERLSAR
jgi:hypothetical protein